MENDLEYRRRRSTVEALMCVVEKSVYTVEEELENAIRPLRDLMERMKMLGKTPGISGN